MGDNLMMAMQCPTGITLLRVADLKEGRGLGRSAVLVATRNHGSLPSQRSPQRPSPKCTQHHALPILSLVWVMRGAVGSLGTLSCRKRWMESDSLWGLMRSARGDESGLRSSG
jgi:hypothetical protein